MSESINTWRLSLVRGRPGLPQSEFLAHWLGPHRDHISALEGVRATRFFVVDSWTPSGTTWDGLGLIGFPTADAARMTFEDQVLKDWIAARAETALRRGRQRVADDGYRRRDPTVR